MDVWRRSSRGRLRGPWRSPRVSPRSNAAGCSLSRSAPGRAPELSDAERQRFAAYLTMGGASFAREREVNDVETAAKYGVPEAMAAYRRSLDDLDL